MSLLSGQMWSVHKELYGIIDAAIKNGDDYTIGLLKSSLKTYLPEFYNILQNPTKSVADHNKVLHANSQGLLLPNQTSPQMLSVDFITEAITLSELFNLNEIAAVDLLFSAENQLSYFPDLPRGLVAVLLYYDGKASLVNCLKLLLQARDGRTWIIPHMNGGLKQVVSTFTEQVIEQGMVSKALDMLRVYNEPVQMDRLQLPEFRAVGPPRHKQQVSEKIKEINASLCSCMFYLSCQSGLSRQDTLHLIGRLSTDSQEDYNSTLSDQTLALFMTFLYAIDVKILEREDSEAWIEKLPILSDRSYLADVNREIMSPTPWSIPGLKTLAQFAWAVTLNQLSMYIELDEYNDCMEELMNSALDQDIFFIMKNVVVANESFYEEEYYIRRMHGLLTDFICNMPLKVKELRMAGDESARIILSRQQDDLDLPPNLSKHFQHFLEFISDLYMKDPLGLELSCDFWIPEDQNLSTSFSANQAPQKQVSLFKFIRLAGDMLLPPLYVSYINMLAGLSNNSKSALHCFNLLKMNSTGPHSSIVSWDHFFMSLNQYYNNLRQESFTDHMQQQQQQQPAFGCHRNNITPQEVEGLRAVLKLITVVVENSEEARVVLSESGRSHPLPIIFGLVECSMPAKLKGDLLETLAAFAKTPEVTANIWQMIENSNILCSVSSSNVLLPGGIHNELEEIESRSEEYPMTRAFIRLVGILVQSSIPPALGAGIRPPGFYPYLEFLRDAVFLKFNSRSYKRPSEKWEVCAGVLEVLHRLVERYNIVPEDFIGSQNIGKDPGYIILLQLFSESNLLKMILSIIDETMKIHERYLPIADRKHMNNSSLYALKIIQVGLSKQERFLETLRGSGSPIIGIGLDKLLMGINPRSGRADHVVNVAKFVINHGSLLEHALSAVDIFSQIVNSPYVQSKIVGLLISSEEFIREMMCGFAECLEYEDEESDPKEFERRQPMTPSEMRVHLRHTVISLLLSSLNHPSPNLTHLLCGFDIKKAVQKTSLQDPGVDGFPRTCLHSVVMMLNRAVSQGQLGLRNMSTFSELAFQFVHSLCTNVYTHAPVLRYLRSHDFLYKQVEQMPYPAKIRGDSTFLLHGSWMLKSIIVDLRVSCVNKQRSYVQRIMELLLNEKMTKGSTNQNKVLTLLNAIDFNLPTPTPLELDIFNKPLIEKVIASCEGGRGGRCDVNLLFNTLVSECSGLTGPLASQAEIALQEINKICANVVDRNAYKQELHARKQAFIAWRQAVEILLTACPVELLAGEKRQLFIFDVLQLLLHKLTPNACPELSSQAACVILILLLNLSVTFKTSETEGVIPHPSCDYVSPDMSMVVARGDDSSSRSTFSTTLQVVLSGLLQYLLTTASLGQKVRIYIYGALLYFFEIAERPVQLDIFVNGPLDRSLEKQLSKKDNDYDKLSRENMVTINKFAGPLLLCLCKDACDGHDVAKMLVMSVLNKILSRDLQKSWISEMSSRGYIQHIINGLVDDDNQLRDLNPRPEPLRALFIFQSKIGLLTRIAMLPYGAQTLLDLDLMSHLAQCTVFDLRPELDHSSPEGFIPTVLSRYRQQILFPVLNLCLTFLNTLGSGNVMAANKVLSFVMSHVDIFLNILSDKQPQHHTLESLRELQLTAALVARTAQDVLLEDMMVLDAMYGELKMCMNRLQRLMMQLLVRFSLFDARRKNLVNQVVQNTRSYTSEEEAGDDNDLKSKIAIVMEEIISSALTLATSLVTKSASNKAVPVLFGPNLSGGMEQYKNSPFSRVYEVSLSSTSSQMPCLGVVVQILDDSTHHFLTTLENHKTLLNKYNNLSDLNPTEVKEICGKDELSDKLSLQQRNKVVSGKLVNLLKHRSNELRLLSYIIENALLLLWRHLEFYLVVCQSRGSSLKHSGAGLDSRGMDVELNRDQLNQLKQECSTWIDDALLRRIQDIDVSYGQSKSKFGFTPVLVRRIKRMLTFNAV